MEGTELVSFNIIAYAGDAKSNYLEAVEHAKSGEFAAAQEKMEEAKVSQLEAHRSHMELLTASASGVEHKIDILLMHAEDQLMMTEMAKMFAEEMINVYSILLDLQNKI